MHAVGEREMHKKRKIAHEAPQQSRQRRPHAVAEAALASVKTGSRAFNLNKQRYSAQAVYQSNYDLESRLQSHL